MSPPLNFHLERYDGPLDLLLDLIRKQQIDIYDIPISSITAQYLKYMQEALAVDVELGAEFVYMAATLIHIKSKLLLPKDPALAEMEGEEDPRQELVERLLEHERFKNAAEMLHQKRQIEEAVWSNPQIEQFLGEDETPGLAITLHDLVRTFQEVLDRTRNRPIYELGKADVSVPDMIEYLKSFLDATPRGEVVRVVDLFERQLSRRAMICLFLAILEMVKVQAVVLAQRDLFGDIVIKRHKKFEEAMASSEAVSTIEKDYN